MTVDCLVALNPNTSGTFSWDKGKPDMSSEKANVMLGRDLVLWERGSCHIGRRNKSCGEEKHIMLACDGIGKEEYWKEE